MRGGVGLLLLAVSAGLVNAQTPVSTSVDRAELLRTQQAPLRDESLSSGGDNGVAPASPNDADLGEQAILKRTENYQPFTIIASLPFSYTSNVALARTDEKGDTLFTPNVLLIYAPRLTKNLTANFSVGQQMFYYDRFSDLNFGSFDARAGLSYFVPRWNNVTFRAAYDYNRLTDDSFSEFFASHSLDFSAEMPFRIGRAQQVTVGGEISVDLSSSPAPPGRNEYSGFIGYSAILARDLTFNAVLRIAVRDYTDADRLDVSEIFALSASYRINTYLSISVTASYAHNGSNRSVFDYDVANGGGALTANVRF